MSENAAGYGILVGVDGSAQSDSAVRWAAREAVMRALPLTLMHVVTPVVVGWPMGPVQANIAEWQEENARAVIAASQKVLYASATEGELQQVRVEIRYAGALTALVDATPNAWMVVVGSSGDGGVGRAVLG